MPVAITPPVAVANFAAAAIAGVNPSSVGPYAVKLAIGGFVVPFFFLFNPGLTVHGTLGARARLHLWHGVHGVRLFAAARHARLQSLGWALRAVLAGCTVALIVPRLEAVRRRGGGRGSGSFLLAKVDVPARWHGRRGRWVAFLVCSAA